MFTQKNHANDLPLDQYLGFGLWSSEPLFLNIDGFNETFIWKFNEICYIFHQSPKSLSYFELGMHFLSANYYSTMPSY